MSTTTRENWTSKRNFILAAAGSAVGLGNIWKFPYIAGENGGAAFLIIYVICILMIGIPILNLEILLGRETQKNPVGAFKQLSTNPLWQYVGGLGVVASFTILSFYSVVGGWSIAYMLEAINGTFKGFENPQVAGEFFNLKNSNANWVLGFHTLFFLITVGIILSGVRKGLEKVSRYLMPLLLLILFFLVFQGLFLPDSEKGLEFLFAPDWSKINAQTFLLALGHAFFTLSLGMGAMMTYGSYLSKKDDIVHASNIIAFLDTFIAILAGVAIFTVVFSSGYSPTAGPGLVFHVLPPLLAKLPLGYIMSIMFFLLLSIAAITSAISILEVSVAYLMDEFSFSRKRATSIMSIAVYLAAIPCALSFNVLSDVTLNIGAKPYTIFDIFDYLASNIYLPLGGFFIALFVGHAWGVDKAIKGLLMGDSNNSRFGNSIFKNATVVSVFGFLVKFISPLLIFLVFLYQFGLI